MAINDADRLEYFYLIRHIPSGKFYAGAKFAKTTYCHPDSFWNCNHKKGYFTSSPTVKQMIKDDGVNSFEVLELIPRPLNDAYSYEVTFLKSFDAARNDKWINKSNGDVKRNGGEYTIERLKRMSESMKLRVQTDEHKHKNSEGQRGLKRPQTEEHRKKNGDANRGRKHPPRSAEACANISKAKLGKKTGPCSDERRLAISKANKGKPSKVKGIPKQKTLCIHCNVEFANHTLSRHIKSNHKDTLS